MLWAVYQIFAPAKYLRIKQGPSLFRSKAVYDWILPGIITIASLIVITAFPSNESIFSEKGFIGGFQKLLEILVPFFIAALAAVATFGRESLDTPMKGHPATLRSRRATGEYAEHVLTRREFVCYLFGYLSFTSLILFVVILLLRLIEDKIGHALANYIGEYVDYAKALLLTIFLFPIWQIIVTTLVGVYFMSERIQVMDDPDR